MLTGIAGLARRQQAGYGQSTSDVRPVDLLTGFPVLPSSAGRGGVSQSAAVGSTVTCQSSSHQHSGHALNGTKYRRNRTVFAEHQLTGLETSFSQQKYLSTKQRAALAARLGLTPTQVKTWYQNRRMKWKKQVRSGG